ncbi:MAG: phenylalanine--tRNA ligase subunit beta [Terriglobales bacterium]
MLISYRWLNEFVACDLPPAALAERLTMAGLAAAGWEERDGDVIFDLEITTNRPDCLSHYGVAREVAALLATRLAPLAASQAAIAEMPPAAAAPRITIEAPAGCARYCARLIEGVRIAASPPALAARLQALGQRPINNAADLTNYVLQEIGQPTHAFDADRLRGAEIRVRHARPGEKLLALDGIERRLDAADLVIADAERPVALAGVIGGEETAISERTRRILIESAWFESAAVRRTAKRHGLHTEASHRFERGADPAMAPLAADRIAARLAAECGGQVAGPLIDVNPRPVPRPAIGLRPSALRLLGRGLEFDEASAILERLGFAPVKGVFQVPSWRGDVKQEVDLVEEAARVAGYDRFPARMPAFAGGARRPPEAERERELRGRLRGHGFAEAMALSFASREECRAFAPRREPIELRNPISEEAAILRTSALPAMLHLLQYNLNRDRADLLLYEMGKTYWWQDGQAREARVLALGACGRAGAGWAATAADRRAYDFFDLKGMLEDVAAGFAAAAEIQPLRDDPAFHPGRSAAAGSGGRRWARCGQLHPDLAAQWKFKTEIYLAEIDLEFLYGAGARPLHFERPSRFPGSERDFSFLFPDSVLWAAVREAIAAKKLAALDAVTPVEVFRGASLPDGHYSLLLRARFQVADRTLREEEIQDQARQIVLALESLGGAQR